jgi:hypothetical protein
MNLIKRIDLKVAAFIIALVWLPIVIYWGVSTPEAPVRIVNPTEQWDAKLRNIHSVDAAMPIVDQYIARQYGTHDERIAKGIDQFLRDRFVHGFSYTPVRENWMLPLLQAVLGHDLHVPVDPDDIMTHDHAMCSQQSIIFMELLRRHGIEYGAVMFWWPAENRYNQGHFTPMAKIDGVWRYYDSDVEARSTPKVADVVNGSAIPTLYPDKPATAERITYASQHGGITLGHINRYAAPRGWLLQFASKWLSLLLLIGLPFLSIFLYIWGRKTIDS